MTTSLPKHPGKVVKLGGREFVLPPMNIKTRKVDEASRKAMATGSTEISEEAVLIAVVLATLQRNYPELTEDVLADLADFAALLDVYLTLKEEEARRMTELGKRAADLYLMAPGQAASTPLTTSSPPSSESLAEAGTDGNRTLTS